MLSSAAALWVLLACAAAAHEVMPSIADMRQAGDRLEFAVQANAEAFVAGIDLAAHDETTEAPQAAGYEALRELPPGDLEARFRAFWPRLAEAVTVRADGVDLPLELTGVEVPAIGDTDLPRSSVIRFSAVLPHGGATEVVVGWEAALGPLVLRQQGVEAPYDGYLEGGALSAAIALEGGSAMGPAGTFLAYIGVGFDHIVPLGLDHILFVLGLFFLAPRAGPLIWQVSAFTVAHTITLALAATGVVSVPASVVEPLIAASIVYVAVENVFSDGLNPWRPALVFALGLLHGLGFASVLGDFGLPPGSFAAALVGFNIGVEIGQLAVIAVAFLVVSAAIRLSAEGRASVPATAVYLALMVATPLLAIPLAGASPETLAAALPLLATVAVLFGLAGASCAVERYESYRQMVAMPASVLIALVGAWWVVERVFL